MAPELTPLDGGASYFGLRGSDAVGLEVLTGEKMPPVRPPVHPKPAPETPLQAAERRLQRANDTHNKTMAQMVGKLNVNDLSLEAARAELAKHGKDVVTNGVTAWVVDARTKQPI